MSPPKKRRHSGVYAILDKTSGWHYIGSSKDMEARRVGPMSAETRALLSERAKAQHAAGLLGRRV